MNIYVGLHMRKSESSTLNEIHCGGYEIEKILFRETGYGILRLYAVCEKILVATADKL